jgi:hypothetical protein
MQPLRKALGQRPAQITTADLYLCKARAFHGGRQTPAHGLNFRQFGHD